jgi:hypothetical protein
MLEVVKIRVTRVPVRQVFKQELALGKSRGIEHSLRQAIVDNVSQGQRAVLAEQLQA